MIFSRSTRQVLPVNWKNNAAPPSAQVEVSNDMAFSQHSTSLLNCEGVWIRCGGSWISRISSSISWSPATTQTCICQEPLPDIVVRCGITCWTILFCSAAGPRIFRDQSAQTRTCCLDIWHVWQTFMPILDLHKWSYPFHSHKMDSRLLRILHFAGKCQLQRLVSGKSRHHSRWHRQNMFGILMDKRSFRKDSSNHLPTKASTQSLVVVVKLEFAWQTWQRSTNRSTTSRKIIAWFEWLKDCPRTWHLRNLTSRNGWQPDTSNMGFKVFKEHKAFKIFRTAKTN